MREADYTARLRKELKDYCYVLKLNVAYAKGVPDCWYSGRDAAIWTEHKKFDVIPPIIDLTNTRITSALQQQWLTHRHAEGRNVGMVVFSPQGHLFLPHLSWQEPVSREDYTMRAVKSYAALASSILDLIGRNDIHLKT